jgi:hypothetical protein
MSIAERFCVTTLNREHHAAISILHDILVFWNDGRPSTYGNLRNHTTQRSSRHNRRSRVSSYRTVSNCSRSAVTSTSIGTYRSRRTFRTSIRNPYTLQNISYTGRYNTHLAPREILRTASPIHRPAYLPILSPPFSGPAFPSPSHPAQPKPSLLFSSPPYRHLPLPHPPLPRSHLLQAGSVKPYVPSMAPLSWRRSC